MWPFSKPIYTRDNGYGDIDTNAPQFQLGRRLYEAQVLYARLEKGETIEPAEIKKLLHWYCELVNWTGMLKAQYNIMYDCATGKAEFRER